MELQFASRQEGGRIPLQEFPVRLRVFIDADSQHHHALRRVRLRELAQRRRLFGARSAPGSPEVQEEQFAAEIRQGHSFAIVGGDGKPGSHVIRLDDALMDGSVKHVDQDHCKKADTQS